MLPTEIQQAVRNVVENLLSTDQYRTYQGTFTDQLQESLCQRFSVSDVLLASSGTAALELALRSVGVGMGDEVLLSGYDYPGNFWAIERVGARPVLIDVEEAGWRIDRDALFNAWSVDSSRKIKALVVSHLHGQLQSVVELRSWCDQRGIVLIEDACQAVGGAIGGRDVGSIGHASIVSFGGGKVLSCGRGGAMLTNDRQVAQSARIAAGAGSGPYTLSELQAAVVVAQMPWLDRVNAECRQYFTEVAQRLTSSSVMSPFASDGWQAAFYQAGFLGGVASQHGSTATEDLLDESWGAELRSSGILANGSWQTKIVGALKELGITAGVGFAGFHRRSSRRCHWLTPMRHTASVAGRTLTVHYLAALLGRISSQRLGEILADLG